jgi:hypothetical protein
VSSRYESKRKDDAGVDIITDMPREIQCKASVNTPNIHNLLTETEADTVFWRKMEKKGERFYSIGEYAMLPMKEFLILTRKAYGKQKRSRTKV